MKNILIILLILIIGSATAIGATVYMDLRHLWRDGDQDFDFGSDDLDPPPPDDFDPVYDDDDDEPLDPEDPEDPNRYAKYIPDPDVTNILLIGIDKRPNERRAPLSDSIMIFSINRRTGKTSLLSIPRDTYVHIQGRGMDKINHSHGIGGAKLLRSTIENFLDIPIHYYFRVNFEGFTNLVDMVGGVDINVEIDIPKHGLKKGRQVLNGEQALKYVRYRGDNDFRRAGRQQQLLVAMAKQIQSQSLHRLPALLDEGVRYIDTDMPFFTLIDFANRFKETDPDTTIRYTLKGRGFMYNKIYYFQPNLMDTKRFVAENMMIPNN